MTRISNALSMTVVDLTHARELYTIINIYQFTLKTPHHNYRYRFSMRKYSITHQKKNPKSLRVIAALMFCLLGFPSNFTGKALKFENDSFNGLLQASKEAATLTSNITNGDGNQAFETNRGEPNFSITANFLIFTTMSFLVSNILLCLLLSYLYSVPYNKEGLLLYLYRDLVKLCLSITWLWTITVIACTTIGNGISIEGQAAKLVANCYLALGMLLLITMNFIAILRLFMVKENMLDPPLPWNKTHYEPSNSNIQFRIANISLTLSLIFILYIYDAYPRMYYNLKGDGRTLLNLPIGTMVISGIEITLIIAYTATSIVTEVLQHTQRLDIERSLPRQWNYLLRANLILAGVFVLCGFLIPHGKGYLWIAFQIIMTTMGVILPGWMIVALPQLRHFVIRRMRINTEYILETSNSLLNYFQIIRHWRRNSRVVAPTV